MSNTIRKVPTFRWNRRPKYRHKLLAGEPLKQVVTDWDDKPIAARKEAK